MQSTVTETRDPAEIERFLRRNMALHVYELGDLDPFFWPYTRWFGLRGGDGSLQALALLYASPMVATLLAFDTQGGATSDLLREIAPALPDRLYTHLSPGLGEVLDGQFHREPSRRHIKMALHHPDRLDGVDDADVERLGVKDAADLMEVYARVYPGNWFDVRMLETERYVGIRRGGQIVCVAGVHVYSPTQRVAALGNITTDPAWRRQGLARRATARLCRLLRETVETVGLNVAANNTAAIRCYEGLGFEKVAEYDEAAAERIRS